MTDEKKPRLSEAYLVVKTRNTNYLFITYIVTSKPKRISVAAGVVHIIFLQVSDCLVLNKLLFAQVKPV
jgi:hypothetical protein